MPMGPPRRSAFSFFALGSKIRGAPYLRLPLSKPVDAGIKTKTMRRFRIKPWSFISISLGIIALLHFAKTHRSLNDENTHLLNEVPMFVFLLKLIPLKTSSWIWGSVMDIKIPTPLRPMLYTFYGVITGVNMDEVGAPLKSYCTMNEFFIRQLKQGVHAIDHTAPLVSPSDGRIVGLGSYSSAGSAPVENIIIDNVKGFKFPLAQFLGEYKQDGSAAKDAAESFSMISPPPKRLYYCTIYLAPSDHHRFNSPTKWNITHMRRIAGEMLPVFPDILKRVPLLYVLNERVPLLGNWDHGRFSMTLVGSTNVGSIKIHKDKTDVLTRASSNVRPWTANIEISSSTSSIAQGDELGYFKMGSSIVLVFEAPESFAFTVKPGQSIRLGEKLGQF